MTNKKPNREFHSVPENKWDKRNKRIDPESAGWSFVGSEPPKVLPVDKIRGIFARKANREFDKTDVLMISDGDLAKIIFDIKESYWRKRELLEIEYMATPRIYVDIVLRHAYEQGMITEDQLDRFAEMSDDSLAEAVHDVLAKHEMATIPNQVQEAMTVYRHFTAQFFRHSAYTLSTPSQSPQVETGTLKPSMNSPEYDDWLEEVASKGWKKIDSSDDS